MDFPLKILQVQIINAKISFTVISETTTSSTLICKDINLWIILVDASLLPSNNNSSIKSINSNNSRCHSTISSNSNLQLKRWYPNKAASLQLSTMMTIKRPTFNLYLLWFHLQQIAVLKNLKEAHNLIITKRLQLYRMQLYSFSMKCYRKELVWRLKRVSLLVRLPEEDLVLLAILSKILFPINLLRK